MYGAVLSALLAALLIGIVSLYAKQREDTVIGALWAVGMASGLLFLDFTPGYFDLMSYLFGDILIISKSDLWAVIGLDLIVVSFSVYFYNKLLAVCYDDEFARLRGIHSNLFYILLLCLTALTIVLLVRVVGINYHGYCTANDSRSRCRTVCKEALACNDSGRYFVPGF